MVNERGWQSKVEVDDRVGEGWIASAEQPYSRCCQAVSLIWKVESGNREEREREKTEKRRIKKKERRRRKEREREERERRREREERERREREREEKQGVWCNLPTLSRRTPSPKTPHRSPPRITT